jgi:hypothetical protein
MSVKPEHGDTGGDSLLVVPPLVRQPLGRTHARSDGDDPARQSLPG